MAQLVVRQLDDDVKEKLQRRARRHGRSMAEEVREILRDAVKDEGETRPEPQAGLGTRIAARFKHVGLDQDIPEMRGDWAESFRTAGVSPADADASRGREGVRAGRPHDSRRRRRRSGR